MRTPEEIKKGLSCPVRSRGYLLDCSNCVYHGPGLKPCRIAVCEDALAYMDQLEEQIQLMKIQMHGDCGVCKHNDDARCYECLKAKGRPLWEYEGLPELPKKGATI